jgi:undecaprenyl-diphosphatase
LELTFFESILFGLISGLTEILPVSAQAHRLIALKLFGDGSEPALLRLILHMSTLAALYYVSNSHITRILRAQKMAKVSARRRRRALDVRSLMDFSLLKTTLIPIVIGFFFYSKTVTLGGNLIIVAATMFVNGVILYIPQFLPGSNKDARSLSRIDGLFFGLGGALSTIPGISCVGAVTSIASVRGADRTYSLNMALLIQIPVTIGLLLFDLVALVNVGMEALSFGVILGYLFSAAAAFAGVVLGAKVMRILAANIGFSIYAFYCWGAALFTFIFYLTAA